MARPEITGGKPKDQPRTGVKVPPIHGPPAAYSIPQFCAAHNISESFYFKLQRQGLGPAEMRLGTRVLITQEAAQQWRREREVVARRPASDPYRFVHDRQLLDLIDRLDAMHDVVVFGNDSLTPQRIEFISAVLDETLDYLCELRVQQTRARRLDDETTIDTIQGQQLDAHDPGEPG
jgi:hypothetical protein